MNKRQTKKEFRKVVSVFPYGRRSKAGIWLKKEAQKIHKNLIEEQVIKE